MASILIIDDEKSVLELLREVLEDAKFNVIEASNGEEGLRLYREKAPDLVITDILMPDREGKETIRELKRDFPEVKIIAMSGGGVIEPDDYLLHAKEFGAAKTIKKPFELSELLKMVNELLYE